MSMKEFRIVDIFDVKNTHSILSSDIIPNSGTVPYLTAGEGNNSVQTYISYDESFIDKGNCIFIGGKTMTVSYQASDFYSNDSHNLALYLKDSQYATESVMLYMIACLKASLGKIYHWGDSISSKKIQKDVVWLPCTENNEIDFQYMEKRISELEAERISELEAERISELEAYLKVAGLDDYALTDEDKNILNVEKKYGEFRVGDLFESSTGDVDLQQSDIDGEGVYFINSGVQNHGIKGRTSRQAKIFPKNTITIDFWGNAYYRDFEYKLATHNHVFSLSGSCIKNELVGLYLASVLSKFANIFSYGNMLTWTKLKDLVIELPCTSNGELDYYFMEQYIRVIEKEMIARVYEGRGKIIDTTRKVVSNIQ